MADMIGLSDEDSVVGLCLATCVIDLVTGKKAIGDVAFIFTDTKILNKAGWEQVIEKLEERVPSASKRDVGPTIRTLCDRGQFFQPRAHRMLPASFLKGQHWISVEHVKADAFLARLFVAAQDAQKAAT